MELFLMSLLNHLVWVKYSSSIILASQIEQHIMINQLIEDLQVQSFVFWFFIHYHQKYNQPEF